MAERTKSDIEICRDHPQNEVANSLIHLRAVDRKWRCDEIASMYCAEFGSEQEANAEFIVRAWNSHDGLVAALESARHKLTELHSHYADMQEASIGRVLAQVDEALAKARESGKEGV